MNYLFLFVCFLIVYCVLGQLTARCCPFVCVHFLVPSVLWYYKSFICYFLPGYNKRQFCAWQIVTLQVVTLHTHYKLLHYRAVKLQAVTKMFIINCFVARVSTLAYPLKFSILFLTLEENMHKLRPANLWFINLCSQIHSCLHFPLIKAALMKVQICFQLDKHFIQKRVVFFNVSLSKIQRCSTKTTCC